MNFPGIEKLVSRMFREADGVVWDIMSGKIGVITADADGNTGISTLTGTGEDAVPNWNPFDDFGVPFPAYAQSTPVAAIQVGDIIFRGKNSIAWVIKKDEKELDGGAKTYKFRIMKPNGESMAWTPPNTQILGFDTGVMVLRTMGSMFGGDAGVNQISGMMMPMMVASQMSGDDSAMKKMFPLILMMQARQGEVAGGAAGGQNMMMQMMTTMVMAQAMGAMGGGQALGGQAPALGWGNGKKSTPFRN